MIGFNRREKENETVFDHRLEHIVDIVTGIIIVSFLLVGFSVGFIAAVWGSIKVINHLGV
jgi:hypothetical protein